MMYMLMSASSIYALWNHFIYMINCTTLCTQHHIPTHYFLHSKLLNISHYTLHYILHYSTLHTALHYTLYKTHNAVSNLVSRELEAESIVVFDEAHNIDNVCIEALSVTLDRCVCCVV